jgi:hypothetical protein
MSGYRRVAVYRGAVRRLLLLVVVVGALFAYRRRRLDEADRQFPAPPAAR